MRWSLFKFLVIFLTLTTTAFCQLQSIDFNGGGARAEGMGKAFLGVSDDISAVSWNPAGLYVHEKPILGISFGSFMPRGKFDYRGTKLDQTGSFNNITFLSFLAPLRIKGHQFVGSICYSKAFDDYSNSAYDTSFYYINAFGNVNPGAISADGEYHGGPYQINIGFGTRIYENISFGLSANILTGKSVSEEHAYTVLENLVRDDSYDQEIFFEEDYTVIDTSAFSGVNFTIGFKYNTEKLNAGLVIKTPYDAKVTTDESRYRITRYNGLVKNNWTDTVFVDDILQKVEMPVIIGLGAGYNLSEKMLVSMDMEYRGFKDNMVKTRTEFSIKPGGDKEETFEETDPLWQDVFTIRMGAEYMWETGMELFPLIPLRLGFAYLPLSSSELRVDSVVILDSVYQVVTTAKAINYNFSAGIGVHWEQIYLDLAYTYSSNDIVNKIYGIDQKLENRYHHFNLTFTGYF
ncbi:MAG: hypothetical protein JXA92_01685 [candidate division Zixibacteria bacterium]|nr:hypothetical protein [candidate division Zixibacteria bacterium]